MTIKTLQANQIKAFFMQPIEEELEGKKVLIPILETEKLHIFANMMTQNPNPLIYKQHLMKLIEDILSEVFPDSIPEERLKFPLGYSIKLMKLVMKINGLEVSDTQKKCLEEIQSSHLNNH